jgi:hypothetical protein
MLMSEFHAAVEARRDGLHPLLKAGPTKADQAEEITRQFDGMREDKRYVLKLASRAGSQKSETVAR